MTEAIRQMLIGMGSIILAPAGYIPEPEFRITLPPENSTAAIAFDFSRISGDLCGAIEKVKHADQLPLI